MNAAVRKVRNFFVSLELTVVLLALGIILVFAATLAQVDLGVWAVQKRFFFTLLAIWHVGPLYVPLPGGYLLGGLLLVNLIAAHVYRFKFAWRKSGILLTHFGIILLLVGELLTGLWQKEYQMRLDEGQTRNYAESYRNFELAITDTTDPKFDRVVSIPASRLVPGQPIQCPELPFRVVTRVYYPNSTLVRREDPPHSGDAPPSMATDGVGLNMTPAPMPVTYRQDEENEPSAFVELDGPDGPVGTWLVSTQIAAPTSHESLPQHFGYRGRSWKIALRRTRLYRPFSITLLKFSHDVYPGTDIPKNFSSRVRLRTANGHGGRDVLIYMNNPLRYAGLTFYQSGYDGEHTTILQVVRNPSWRLPYVACVMVALGLVIQFGIHLAGFGRKRRRAAESAEGARGGGFAVEDASVVRASAARGMSRDARDRRASPPVPAGFQPRGSAPPAAGPGIVRFLPHAVLIATLIGAGFSLLPPKQRGPFDLTGFGRLPALAQGRFKPLDTVARSSLLQMQNRQEVRSPLSDRPLVAGPVAWLLDVMYRPNKADTYPTFVIDNSDLLSLIGRTDSDLRIVYPDATSRFLATIGFLPSRYRRFSFQEISPHLSDVEEQARLANEVDSNARNAFQRAVLQLYDSLVRYEQLRYAAVMPADENFLGELFRFQNHLAAGVAAVRAKQAGKPHDEKLVAEMLDMGGKFSEMAARTDLLLVPPDRGASDPGQWRTTGEALLESFQTGATSPVALAYAGFGRAWRDQDAAHFNGLLGRFRKDLVSRYPNEFRKTDVEVRFNAAQPFYTALLIHVAAFLLAVTSWLVWPELLGRSAFRLVAVAWLVTTAGILVRMWLEGRPPVTNLYSSALFVGWGAVGLCLVLEYAYRNGIASAAAGLIGFATLLIAHMLSLSGDTLEMMRAVLDSNFWLGTHVVVVTLGYASTFLAGVLALFYVVRGVFTRSLDKSTADVLTRMVYGIVCFATLFSFAGTVLGGIWADQSWGRFWGWDPKENGALIIVMWNAIILHARWGGMVRQRGLVALALIGNIVTSWSWFGTNMLGIGLHSYGFTQAAFVGLSMFIATQLGFIALAMMPLDRWRSFRPRPAPARSSLQQTAAAP